MYLQPEGPDITRLLCRWMDRYYNPLYSCYGVHELIVRRKGSSLQFRRWSSARAHPTLWVCLFFKTWEKMVLFHSAFGALKARCLLTLDVTPEDVCLGGERRLFLRKIIDDGFEHNLTVLQDKKCGGLRLQAAVRNGELRGCPIWTAFVTHQSASPRWMDRRSRHRIWLRDIQPYVFCQKYKKKHQTRKHGEFEILFVNAEAADAFEEVFREESESSPIIEVVEGTSGDTLEWYQMSLYVQLFSGSYPIFGDCLYGGRLVWACPKSDLISTAHTPLTGEEFSGCAERWIPLFEVFGACWF